MAGLPATDTGAVQPGPAPASTIARTVVASALTGVIVAAAMAAATIATGSWLPLQATMLAIAIGLLAYPFRPQRLRRLGSARWQRETSQSTEAAIAFPLSLAGSLSIVGTSTWFAARELLLAAGLLFVIVLVTAALRLRRPLQRG